MSQGQITVMKGGQLVRQHPLTTPLRVGRHRNAGLQLEDPQLSRFHAEITWDGAKLYIKDLNSLNGTFLGGAKLEPDALAEIAADGVVRIADFEITFELQGKGKGETKSKSKGEGAGTQRGPEWNDAPPAESPLMEHLVEGRSSIPIWSKGQLDLQIADIIEETEDVKTFRLVGKKPLLFSYKPGQFVTVLADIDGKPVRRSYSISSSPSRPHTLELTVKRVPGGLMSNWMCDSLKLGDDLTVIGPSGKFTCFTYPSRKMLCISAGSGITPMMSMSRWVVDTTADVDIVFVHSARSPSDIIFRKELELMSARHSGFRPIITITRGWRGVESWTGFTGHCNARLLGLAVPDLHERHIYMCGPEPFMNAVKEALVELEYDMANLRTESFGEGRVAKGTKVEPRDVPLHSSVRLSSENLRAPRAQSARLSARVATPVAPSVAPSVAPAVAAAVAADVAVVPGVAHEVSFIKAEKKVTCDGEVSLLDLAEVNGIEIPYGCRTGACGLCKVRCTAGSVKHGCDDDELALEADELKQGYALACVAFPQGDCSIEEP